MLTARRQILTFLHAKKYRNKAVTTFYSVVCKKVFKIYKKAWNNLLEIQKRENTCYPQEKTFILISQHRYQSTVLRGSSLSNSLHSCKRILTIGGPLHYPQQNRNRAGKPRGQHCKVHPGFYFFTQLQQNSLEAISPATALISKLFIERKWLCQRVNVIQNLNLKTGKTTKIAKPVVIHTYEKSILHMKGNDFPF